MIHKNTLKSYAPEARKEFIKAITERAAFYGITDNNILPCEIKGDFAFISGRPFPKEIDKRRNDLISRVQKAGFHQTMEEIAYTWFNRLIAIRFMEVNGYLSHGYRVLSHPEKDHNEPEILEKAQFIEKLDGLGKDEILKLKTAIGKESELYRRLIIAQCSDLSIAMPFLFEQVDDPTELLLPDNLLNTDSLVRKIVTSIPEEDWKEVEIVGWLYQFYISEKKDGLMQAKKAYKAEEIPAVTQLFTPNWIVKYLVQNSLGAKWLAIYPKVALKEKMQYYIAPAEQSEEVKAKIKEITPVSLNPEDLTVMDPACGSGHILVEAYDLLKDIYLERGYRARDIAGLILTKNLYGLEIDERAAQLASFALLMKAYADDHEIFKKGIKTNIICLNESNKVSIGDICRNIESAYTGKLSNFRKDKLAFMDEVDLPLFAPKRENGNNQEQDETIKIIYQLLALFHNAKTFGSLIRIPEDLSKKLPSLFEQLDKWQRVEDWLIKSAIFEIIPFVKQAEVLSKRYDCVIANPPYMGGKYMNPQLKEFVKDNYKGYEKDLFSAFIIRGRELAKENGNLGFMSPFVWMFITSHEDLRLNLINRATLSTLIQLEYSGFAEATVPICTFTFLNTHYKNFKGSFIRLSDFRGSENQAPKTLEAIQNKKCGWFYTTNIDDFKKIPGSPVAYWVSDKVRDLYSTCQLLKDIAEPKQGMATTDNDKYLRFWWELDYSNVGFNLKSMKEALNSKKKWFPYNKGGSFRKWSGNHEYVVDWGNDGAEIKNDVIRKYPYLNGNVGFVLKLTNPYFEECLTWTATSSSYFGIRHSPSGFMFDVKGSSCFCEVRLLLPLLGFLASNVTAGLLKAINPTIEFQNGNLKDLPISPRFKDNNFLIQVETVVKGLIDNSKHDWDSFETSWDFTEMPILRLKQKIFVESYQEYRDQCANMTVQTKQLEEENNRLFIGAYGLQDELAFEVPIEEITLFTNPNYRYRGELTEEEIEGRFKTDTMKEILSYVVGCMMGRYSFGMPGLVYAHARNEGFDSKKYKIFFADDDGIIPIADGDWFNDDVTCQFFRFIETSLDKKELDGNLDFIADAIGRRSGESSREAIRKYFVNDFYKDHCQTYKNRPIYWLFSSGKEKAFQALVYLHRYNEGTLARMRTEYVLPLQTKIMRQIAQLEKDKDVASGSSANKIQKEITTLRKQQIELAKFDEKLRHYADMKIKLDLDDGVKANYLKFGELLEPIKGLKNGSEED